MTEVVSERVGWFTGRLMGWLVVPQPPNMLHADNDGHGTGMIRSAESHNDSLCWARWECKLSVECI